MKNFLICIFLFVKLSFAQNFHPSTIDNMANGARYVSLSDVDQDHDTDIVVANYSSNEIVWYKNTGNQNFIKNVIASNYDGANSVYAMDMDKDGDIDIIGCAYLEDKITWWENDGDENFSWHDIDSTFDGAYSVMPCDMDKDGDIDVVGAAGLAGQLVVWYNDSIENFSKDTIGNSLNGITMAFPVDLDLDHDMDVLATVNSTNQTLWFQNNASVFSTLTIDNTISGARLLYAKDMDHDTDMDIVVVGNGEVSWFRNNGVQSFTKYILDQNFTNGQDVYADDFDNDGDEDILGAANNGEFTIWENDGWANFYEWTISNAVNGTSFVRTGDIDSDGNKDLVSAAFSGNNIQWWRQETLVQKLDAVDWNTQNIYPGVKWMSHIFDTLFNSNQSLNITDVDLNTAPVDVVFDGVSSGFKKTSDFGIENSAIAGVNGNFFNTSSGGSVNYITRNYSLINNGTNFFNTARNEAALTVSDEENVIVDIVPLGGNWATASQKKFMISCGPRLLVDHAIKPNPAESFNVQRNPRTFVGITADDHLLLFTVDGRATQAAGMSMLELTKLAKAFGCKDAFNLDGGGSTTMWVNGQPANGVVNYPSDNHVFDHFGERACANAILILPNITKAFEMQLCAEDSTLFQGHYLSETGIYRDTLDTNNKFGQDSILVLDLGVADTINTPEILGHDTTLASSVSGTGYHWYLNGNLMTEHDSAITPVASGNYVLVVEINGCLSDSSDVYPLVLNAIYENKADNIHLWPNPADGKIWINGLSAFIGESVFVYSANGSLVISFAIKNNTMTLDCSRLESGVYVLKINDITKKLVISH